MGNSAMASHYVIHNWLIDKDSGSLIHQLTGEKRRLGEYQFKLLLTLAQHAGKTLTREELTSLVWERRVIGNNSLPNAVHALRVALEDNGKQQRIIKTIPKKGYILEAEYCQWLLPDDEQTVSSAPDEITASPFFTANGQIKEAEAREEWQNKNQQPGALPQQEVRKSFWRWLCLAQAILLLTLLFFLMQ